MDLFSPRAYTPCTSGKQWYVCSKGDYQGCCSSDPCTTGICPDDESTSSSLTTSRAPTPTTSSTSTTASTSPETAQTTSSTTSSTTALATADQTTSVLAASTTGAETTTPASAGSKSSTNAALIGGVVGGIVALLLCAILFWFCWRRRRREQAFNVVSLHRSVSSQSLHEQKTTSPVKPSPNPSGANTFRRNRDSLAPSTTGSNANTTISAPDSWSLSIPGLTSGGPSEASTLSSGMPMTENKPQNTRDLPPIPQESELPAPLPRGAGFTPELPETTVSRTRAELPSHPRSELINVPLSQRTRLSAQNLRSGPGPGLQQQQQQSGSSSRSWDSPSTSASTNASPYPSPSTTAATSTTSPALMTRSTARRIVTDEGVVLGANLDRYSVPTGSDAEQGRHGNWNGNGDGDGGRRERNAQDHVMSFMEFGEGVGAGDRRDRLYRRYGNGSGNGHGEEGARMTMPEAYARAVEAERAARDAALLEEDCSSPTSDVPPAYESGGFSPRDRKSPSATMGLGLRGMERE